MSAVSKKDFYFGSLCILGCLFFKRTEAVLVALVFLAVSTPPFVCAFSRCSVSCPADSALASLDRQPASLYDPNYRYAAVLPLWRSHKISYTYLACAWDRRSKRSGFCERITALCSVYIQSATLIASHQLSLAVSRSYSICEVLCVYISAAPAAVFPFGLCSGIQPRSRDIA